MNLLLATILLLQPVMDEPGYARFVADETDGLTVWQLEGAVVGTTVNREPLRIWLDAGAHNVTARATGDGWIAMVRPEPTVAGAHAVPAWSAEAPASARVPDAPLVTPGSVIASLGAVGLAWVLVRR